MKNSLNNKKFVSVFERVIFSLLEKLVWCIKGFVLLLGRGDLILILLGWFIYFFWVLFLLILKLE